MNDGKNNKIKYTYHFFFKGEDALIMPSDVFYPIPFAWYFVKSTILLVCSIFIVQSLSLVTK